MATADPAAERPRPVLSFLERASDWLNPILIKETRQSLKSRQFVATFFLMLIASWMISLFGMLFSGAGVEYRATGGWFFMAYYVVLAVAIFLVVPFGAFRSMLGERDMQTWEVLSISTLKPRQIVWGKLTSAIVQMFIYYSAITPFMAFANLLKGIDVPTIALILVCSMLWSVALSILSLSVSTFGNQKFTQAFLTLAVLGGLVAAMSMGIAMAVQVPMILAVAFDEPGFWWAVGIWVTTLTAYCILSLQIAVSQLTFDSDNRSSGIRLAAAGIFWLGMAWMGAMAAFGGVLGLPAITGSALDSMLEVFAVMSGLHWFAIGLFAVTETEILSRRVRRNIQRLGAFRVLAAPFLPGGSRGLVYIIGHLSALALLVFGLAAMLGSSDAGPVNAAIAVWCYIVIYLGFGAALGRVARMLSGDFRPAHARVLTILLLAAGVIAPHVLAYFLNRMPQSTNPAFFVTDPISTSIDLGNSRSDMGLTLILLGGLALISIVANLRAMIVGIIDVSRPYIPPAPALTREMMVAAPPPESEAVTAPRF
ncbi:MAG: ABC transporter permease [Planctomycetales bacterium]